MLKIYFGELEGVIHPTSLYFNNNFEKEWILNDFSRKVIKDVDKK